MAGGLDVENMCYDFELDPETMTTYDASLKASNTLHVPKGTSVASVAAPLLVRWGVVSESSGMLSRLDHETVVHRPCQPSQAFLLPFYFVSAISCFRSLFVFL